MIISLSRKALFRNQKTIQFGIHSPYRHFTIKHRDEQSDSNDDDAQFKRILAQQNLQRVILKNYKTAKTLQPQVIQIDAFTKEAKLLSEIPTKNFKSFKHSLHEKLSNTFLPADYPDSVTKEYLPFTIYGNISSISITAMTFLSTQALFVALGG